MSNTTPGWGKPEQQPQGQGWGHPGQQQQPQGYYAPQPPKKHTGRNVALGCGSLVVLAIVGIIIAAVAASGGSGSSKTNAKDGNAPLTSSNNSAHPPVKDLKLDGCTIDTEIGFASVNVTITNHTSKPSDYNVQVEFTDKAGTRLDTGYAIETNVRPGQVVKSKAQGLEQVKGPITCKVVSADRTASLG